VPTVSKQAVRMHREAMRHAAEQTRRIGALAFAIHAQWWRVIKNRERRREIRAILAASDVDGALAQGAWQAMSPSEQAAENERVMRGAAIKPPSS
jgi:hypothetical protein